MPGSTVLKISLTETTRSDLAILSELKSTGVPLSRQALKQLFKEGLIFRNDRPLSPSVLLNPGQHHIEIRAAGFSNQVHQTSQSLQAFAQPSQKGSFIPVVYEDEFLLILNKPSQIPSVPHSQDETETAVGSALAHFPKIASVGTSKLEPGLLHRLDTGTSGLLVFAKTPESFQFFKSAWKSGQVKKIYRAICSSPKHKPIPKVPMTLTPYLAHSAKSSRRMMIYDPDRVRMTLIRGKPLPTHTLILALQPLASDKIDITVEIKTGVMHQIRCTLESMGWPIMGDTVYSGEKAERLHLHAWKLELPAIEGTAKLLIEAPLPEQWPKSPNQSKS